MSIESAAPHALVTGSSSGIGLAIAERLLNAGWRVTGADLAPAALRHAAFTPLVVDLSDPAQCRALTDSLDGVPDALVHAAGRLRTGRLGSLSPDDDMCMWTLHVRAATCLANALASRMANRGAGRVVLLGSRVAGGLPGRSQYAASKAAIIALARSWAAELVTRGVTVNVVSPGATATAMLDAPSRASSAPVVPPLGRLIEPVEVADLVAYLLSPQAGAITGQEIVICGGASLSY